MIWSHVSISLVWDASILTQKASESHCESILNSSRSLIVSTSVSSAFVYVTKYSWMGLCQRGAEKSPVTESCKGP